MLTVLILCLAALQVKLTLIKRTASLATTQLASGDSIGAHVGHPSVLSDLSAALATRSGGWQIASVDHD